MILCLLLVALQYDPNLSPKFAEALRLMQEKKYPEVIAIVTPLTKDKPKVGEYWSLLGVAYAASGDLEQAIPNLRIACDAQPRPPRACFQYGRVLHLSNRFEDALKAYGQVAKGSEDAQLHSAKAQSYEALGRAKEADQAFRAALAESALRPANSAEVQLRYGLFLYRQGTMESALWQFEQVIRKQPFWGIAWREKARALLQLEREKESAEALEQAIAHGERNRENLLLLSRLYLRLGDTAKAEDYRKEAAAPQQ